jgi:Tfp pilus assembly protein PilN
MMPHRLELDFIAAPHRRRWLGYTLLAVSLLVATDLVVRFRDAQTEVEHIEAAKGLLSTEREAAKAAPKERLDEQVRNAEAIVRQLTLPWAMLIQTLEEAAISDVAILQLQPEAQQRLLRVMAEARNQEAMLEYVRRLAGTQTLLNVHLVNHQIQLEDPQRPIQFSVQATFKGSP